MVKKILTDKKTSVILNPLSKKTRGNKMVKSMKILSAMFIGCALVMYAGGAYAAKPKPNVKIMTLDGTIEIKQAGKTILVKPGDQIPELDATAKIKVLSGNVTIQTGDNKGIVKADAGANFSFTSKAGGNDVSIKTAENSSPVQFVPTGGQTVLITADSNIKMTMTATECTVKVTQGNATVTDNTGNTQMVTKGETVTTAIEPVTAPVATTVTAPKPVVPAPAPAPEVTAPVEAPAPAPEQEPAAPMVEQPQLIQDAPPPPAVNPTQTLEETQEIVSPSAP